MIMQPLEASTHRRPALFTAKTPHVLLVEDDAEMRAMVRTALTGSGFDVSELPDGERALEFLGSRLFGHRSRQKPDLIVTDNRMPYCDGIDILHALRLLHEEVPLIMITAFGDPALHAEVVEQPNAVVLDKPFDLDVLIREAWAASGASPTRCRARHRRKRRGARPERRCRRPVLD